ncbi:hypothetical protein C8J57DRAFT_1368165, partial [Mycena rebaudengoi]
MQLTVIVLGVFAMVEVYCRPDENLNLWTLHNDFKWHALDPDLYSWMAKLPGVDIVRTVRGSFSAIETLIITGPPSLLFLLVVLHSVISTLVSVVTHITGRIIRHRRIRVVTLLLTLFLVWRLYLSPTTKQNFLQADYSQILHRMRDALPSTWRSFYRSPAGWIKFGVARGRGGPTWDALPLGTKMIIVAPGLAYYLRYHSLVRLPIFLFKCRF